MVREQQMFDTKISVPIHDRADFTVAGFTVDRGIYYIIR